MTREEIKGLLPLLQAYADGKALQYYYSGEWIDLKEGEDLSLVNYPKKYRIKPTPTYRPFANAEECWNEMLKHQPFGWVKDKEDGHYTLITCVDDEVYLNAHGGWSVRGSKNNFTFADGSAFGVKVEEE